MSEAIKSPSKNIFLKDNNNNNNNNRFAKKHIDRRVLPTTEAKIWLEKHKPKLQSIDKHTLTAIVPKFVQDYICAEWIQKTTDAHTTFEKPEERKHPPPAARWNVIREELEEHEEIKNQENSFKKSRIVCESPRRSRFRPRSYQSKPRKIPKFDLAKEEEGNGFPTLS